MLRWKIERAGVVIIVAVDSASEPLVAAALAGMRAQRVPAQQAAETEQIELSVSASDGAWVLHDAASDLTRSLDQPGDLIYHLTDRIVFHVADNAQQAHCLHAAAVADNGRALVVPADSGAGKSTFTTWMVTQGFDYITDELILIDELQRVDGLARPIQIKPNGIDAVKPLLQNSATIYPGKLANAVPITSLAGGVSELPSHALGAILFPQYTRGVSYSLRKLTSADAGMRLMANHVNARNLEGHGFRAMMALIRATDCYALEYGGFDTLPNDFADQVKSLLM